MPYINGRYLNDEEMRGYEAARRDSEGRYSERHGSYDYEQGWKRQEDDARYERHRAEDRQREEAEQLAAERRAQERRMEEQAEYDVYCAEMDARIAQEQAYSEAMARAEAEAMEQEQAAGGEE